MKIEQFNSKKVRVTAFGGKEFIGRAKFVTSADNDDEGEVLWLRTLDTDEIWQFEPEDIESIE